MPFFDSKKNLKDSIILFAGRFIVGLGTVVSIRVITEMVSPFQLGRFYYCMAIGGFFSLVLFNPMMVYVNKSCIHWFQIIDGLKNAKSVLIYWIWAALACALLLSFVWYFMGASRPMGLLYFLFLIPLIILSDTVISSGNSMLNFIGYRFIYVVINSFQVWGVFLGTVLAVLLFGTEAENMIVGRMAAQVLLVGLVIFFVWKTYKRNETVAAKKRSALSWRAVWHFCWPIALTQVFFWAQFQGFRIPLKATAGEYGVGIFSVILGFIVAVFSIFDSLFTQLYAPIFWKNVTDKDFIDLGSDLTAYLKNHWCYLIIYSFWILGIASFAFRIFLAEAYRGYYYLVVLIVLSEAIRIAGTAPSYAMNAIHKNFYFLLPAVLCFVICMGGVYFLGRVMDPLFAAALSLAASCLAQLGVMLFFAKKNFVYHIPLKDIRVAAMYGLPLWFALFMLKQFGFSASVQGCFVVLLLSAVALGVLFFLMSKRLTAEAAK